MPVGVRMLQAWRLKPEVAVGEGVGGALEMLRGKGSTRVGLKIPLKGCCLFSALECNGRLNFPRTIF